MTMTLENDLFDWGCDNPVMQEGALNHSTRRCDHDTSVAAAESVRSCARGHRLTAMKLLRDRGPMTDFELAEITGMQQTSIGKRRSECFQNGLIVKLFVDGKSIKRPAPSGAGATVWALSVDGYSFLQEHEAQFAVTK